MSRKKSRRKPVRKPAVKTPRKNLFERNKGKLLATVTALFLALVTTVFTSAGAQIYSALAGHFRQNNPRINVVPIPASNSSSSQSSPPFPSRSSSDPGKPSHTVGPVRGSTSSTIPVADPLKSRVQIMQQAAYSWVLPGVMTPAQEQSLGDETKAALQGSDPNNIPAVFRNWMYAQGGADGGASYMQVTVTASTTPIDITGVGADIVSRQAPFHGTSLVWPGQGEVQAVPISLDLDSSLPISSYFENHDYHLSPGETAVFDVMATTRTAAVAWRLILTTLFQGKQMTIDAGQIFHTTEIFAPKYNSNYQIVAAPGTYAADWQYDIQLNPNSQPAHWEQLYPRPNSPSPAPTSPV